MSFSIHKIVSSTLLVFVFLAFTKINNPVPSINPIQNSDIIKISSSFGMRKHPISKEEKMHNGCDIIAKLGVPVHATADGIVLSIEFNDTGYGNKVVIQHVNSIKTLYAQLNEIKAEEGQKVSQNDVIGTVGSSGASTGPHLHYEVIDHDKHVDPENYFAK